VQQKIIGIDEVGRGAWAGPLLVVAAENTRSLPSGLADSKVLSKQKRERFYEQLINCCNFSEGWVWPSEVDELGLTDATKLGVLRALNDINAHSLDQIIIDGHINYCSIDYLNAKAVVGADATVDIVSAASIYAKVKRDNHMILMSMEYPDYGFEKNVGYGTKLHREMLKTKGITKIHRLSYKPLKGFL
jgi:ribonuclease HII